MADDALTIADIASAGVLLGLLPTILIWIGPNTVETGLLAARRPTLAALLALRSPAVSPMRSFDYRSPFQILQTRESDQRRNKLFTNASFTVTVVQYLVTLGAIIKIGLVIWDLTVQVVFVMATETEFLPIIWALMAFAIHISAAAALMLRVRLEEVRPSSKPLIRRLLEREAQPCIQHAPSRLTLRDESYVFTTLSWLTSIGTVVYLIYGTFMFSGALFIILQQAEVVAGRFFASVAVCRIILMYELGGMRVVVDVKNEDEGSSGRAPTAIVDGKTAISRTITV